MASSDRDGGHAFHDDYSSGDDDGIVAAADGKLCVFTGAVLQSAGGGRWKEWVSRKLGQVKGLPSLMPPKIPPE